MRISSRCFLGAAMAAVLVFASAAVVHAETCTLELKRLEPQGREGNSMNYLYRAGSPQSFFSQLGKQGDSTVLMSENPQQTEAFKKIVKKEPKYESEYPFRGVAKFGSQEFAFVLDAVPPKSDDKDPKKDGEKKTDDKAKSDKPESAVAGLASQFAKAMAPEKKALPKIYPYNRLYFDFNRNGDLTDDKVIESEKDKSGRVVAIQSYHQIQFPRVDVTIDDEGTPVEYSFFLEGYMNASRDYSYASISLGAAAYREGDITLNGKKRHIVLIDFNSDGRFDSEIKVRNDIHSSDGQVYAQTGDMILVDLNASNPGMDSPYDITTGDCRHYVSKLLNIDGAYYDVKITPAGDQFTLTPSTAALGNVKNSNDGYKAVLYGDKGFLKIAGKKDASVAIPEGEWKLLSYTINLTDTKPQEPEKKKEEAKEGSLLEALAKKMQNSMGGPQQNGRAVQYTMVTAQATSACKPVKVVKGETVEIPFGPPYKPTVTAEYFEDGNQRKVLSLGMSLTGSAGEICSNMMVNSGRPSKPEFIITDSKGKEVQKGSFEYG
jgi:hypothetical protein